MNRIEIYWSSVHFLAQLVDIHVERSTKVHVLSSHHLDNVSYLITCLSYLISSNNLP